ncbi:MAG: helix-turn-helix domain-containing protein, partial [Prevotellaceae bacterium]|nr:helix-turn-helix domain-containing protein [Prevotellaceae bacterium]
EVMQLLGLKESALRHMMCERRIPYYRQGKRAWFNRKEIEAWQLRNRVATNEEIDSAAATHCALHKIGITI